MIFTVTKDFIPGLPKNPYRYGHPEGIVLHETGAWGGTDTSNRLYEVNHWESAFVHFFVDWDSITQVADTDYLAWGAGWYANQRFIHIELVRTKDYKKFVKSYRRYVWLAVKMLRKYGLKPSRRNDAWTHKDVTLHLGGTSHVDPDAYLQYHGFTVQQLIDDINKEYKHNDSKFKIIEGHNPKTPKNPPKNNEMDQLHKGDVGEAVLKLQEKLKKLGFYDGELDGLFGPKTDNALREFQKSEGIDVDGWFGEISREHLQSAMEEYKESKKDNNKEITSGSFIGKRVESHYDGVLDFYSKPTWDDDYRVGQLKEGYGFPNILAKVEVDGAWQYKVENSDGDVFYVTASDKFVHVEGEGKSKPAYVGKRVEAKVDNLRFYNKPSWDDEYLVNTIDKGVGFPEIVEKIDVDGHPQYKVKNSDGDVYYITASSKYVKVTKND